MANGNVHHLHPEGRRPAASPRRLRVPVPANDNGAPLRHRLKQAAFVAVLIAMAVGLALVQIG